MSRGQENGVHRPMKDFLDAAGLLLFDLASTLVFLLMFLLTHNTMLSIGLGIAFGVAQIGFQFARRSRRRHGVAEPFSLFLVVAAGTATLLTHDPRFVLFKPSVMYVIVGAVMIKPGWLNRHLPETAKTVVPDVAAAVGLA
jgi:intracellular septation protein